jgi:protein SCO1/2
MTEADQQAPQRRINPWSVWLLILIMLGGIFVFYNYVLTLERQSEDYRPGKVKRIDENFLFTRHDGKQVTTGDLEGKVWLVSHVFTRCPGQCAGITAEMKTFQQQHADNPLFNLVSVSMDPDYDTPEILTEFRKSHELTGDNWWFVTGPAEALNGYMFKYFFFKPIVKTDDEKEQANDIYKHDSKVALVDHARNVRDWYDLFDKDDVEKLKKDLEIVLKEAADEAAMD